MFAKRKWDLFYIFINKGEINMEIISMILTQVLKPRMEIVIRALSRKYKVDLVFFETLNPQEKHRLKQTYHFQQIPCLILNRQLVAGNPKACFQFAGINPTMLGQVNKHGSNFSNLQEVERKGIPPSVPPPNYIPPKVEEYPIFVVPPRGLLGQKITNLQESTTVNKDKTNLFEIKAQEREMDLNYFKSQFTTAN